MAKARRSTTKQTASFGLAIFMVYLGGDESQPGDSLLLALGGVFRLQALASVAAKVLLLGPYA
jgi:hypothetical protein